MVSCAIDGTHIAFNRLHNHLRTDLLYLDQLLDQLGGRIAPLADPSRRPLYLLHAVRIALMMRVMLFAVELPTFAPRSEYARESVTDMLMHMRIEEAAQLISDIFRAKGLARRRNLMNRRIIQPSGRVAIRTFMRT